MTHFHLYVGLALLALSTSLMSQQVETTANSPPKTPHLTAPFSKLIGLEVVNDSEDNIGEIGDLLIDPSTGGIRFVILEVGGFLGINEDPRAVPFRLITITADQDTVGAFQARTKIETTLVKTAPLIKKGQTIPANIGAQVNAIFGKSSTWDESLVSVHPTAVDACPLVRLSDLLATKMSAADGTKIGSICEIVVAPNEKCIAYSVVKTDEREIALPWSCVRVEQNKSDQRLGITTTVAANRFAAAPEYDLENWAHMSTDEWMADTANYYSARPIWTSKEVVFTEKPSTSGIKSDDLLVSANKLHNTTIRDDSNVDLGELGDVLIDGKTGEILFAVIDVGGFLGMGEDQRIIPWNQVSMVADQDNVEESRCLTSLTKEQLGGAPELADGPIDSGRIAERVRLALGNTQVKSTDANVHRQLYRVTKMMGVAIRDPEGKEIGKVADIFLATRSGRVAYAVVDADEEAGGRKIGLCQSRLLFESKKDGNLTASTTIERAKFTDAPEFDGDNWLRMTDAKWVSELAKYYGAEIYWSSKTITATGKDSRDSLTLCPTDILLGVRLDANDQKDFGKIRDFLVNQKTGEIRFAVITVGASGEQPEVVRALPWKQIEVNLAENSETSAKAVTGLTAAEAKARPELSSGCDQVMDLSRKEERQFGEVNAASYSAKSESILVRLGALIGARVQDKVGSEVGTLRDLIVEPSTGRVAYVVLAMQTATGPRTIAAPWSLIQIQNGEGKMVQVATTVSNERLQRAPMYHRMQWQSMSSRDYMNELATYYGTQTF